MPGGGGGAEPGATGGGRHGQAGSGSIQEFKSTMLLVWTAWLVSAWTSSLRTAGLWGPGICSLKSHSGGLLCSQGWEPWPQACHSDGGPPPAALSHRQHWWVRKGESQSG